jgi:hypothetical protein
MRLRRPHCQKIVFRKMRPSNSSGDQTFLATTVATGDPRGRVPPGPEVRRGLPERVCKVSILRQSRRLYGYWPLKGDLIATESQKRRVRCAVAQQ